jgi:5-methylcytosine-specific restriction endonuclease McrA
MMSASIVVKYAADPEFRDRVISAAQNRRVRALGLEEITQPKHLTAWLMERDQGICALCNGLVTDQTGPWRPSIDHIIPISRGGLHKVENLQLAHYRCNLKKHNKLEEELPA